MEELGRVALSSRLGAIGDETTQAGSASEFETGYEILEELGVGGFGRVHRALDRALGREVAVKTSKASIGNLSLDERARILREARALAAVDHPGIVRVYSVAEHGGRILIAMELVRGRTLQSIVREHGPMSPEEAAQVGVRVCSALAELHAKGLVHRDVKPANIMRAPGGRIVLLDLGFARQIQLDPSCVADAVAGTPLLMAPEQLDATAKVDPRADVYALGVTLYWLTSAAYPIDARTLNELQQRFQSGRVVPLRDRRPDVPLRFASVVERASALRVEERFATVGELERELLRFLSTGRLPGEVSRSDLPTTVAIEPAPDSNAPRCASCGTPRTGLETYCRACGSVLMSSCPRCSGPVDIGARFCGKCGLDVESHRAIDALLRLAAERTAAGELDEAHSKLLQAQALAPAREDLAQKVRESKRMSNLVHNARESALRFESKGRLSNAKSEWDRIVAVCPENAEAKAALGRLVARARRQRLENLCQQIELAVRKPDWQLADRTFQELRRHAGAEAVELVERAESSLGVLQRTIETARRGVAGALAAGELDRAREWIDELERLGEPGADVLARRREWEVLRLRVKLEHHLRAGDAEKAITCLRELQSAGRPEAIVGLERLTREVESLRERTVDSSRENLRSALARRDWNAAATVVATAETLGSPDRTLGDLRRTLDAARSRARLRSRILRVLTACGIAAGTLVAGVYAWEEFRERKLAEARTLLVRGEFGLAESELTRWFRLDGRIESILHDPWLEPRAALLLRLEKELALKQRFENIDPAGWREAGQSIEASSTVGALEEQFSDSVRARIRRGFEQWRFEGEVRSLISVLPSAIERGILDERARQMAHLTSELTKRADARFEDSPPAELLDTLVDAQIAEDRARESVRQWIERASEPLDADRRAAWLAVARERGLISGEEEPARPSEDSLAQAARDAVERWFAAMAERNSTDARVAVVGLSEPVVQRIQSLGLDPGRLARLADELAKLDGEPDDAVLADAKTRLLDPVKEVLETLARAPVAPWRLSSLESLEAGVTSDVQARMTQRLLDLGDWTLTLDPERGSFELPRGPLIQELMLEDSGRTKSFSVDAVGPMRQWLGEMGSRRENVRITAECGSLKSEAVSHEMVVDVSPPRIETLVSGTSISPGSSSRSATRTLEWSVANDDRDTASVIVMLRIGAESINPVTTELELGPAASLERRIDLAGGQIPVVLYRRTRSQSVAYTLEFPALEEGFPLGLDRVSVSVEVLAKDGVGNEARSELDGATIESPRWQRLRFDPNARESWRSNLTELVPDLESPACTSAFAGAGLCWIEAGLDTVDDDVAVAFAADAIRNLKTRWTLLSDWFAPLKSSDRLTGSTREMRDRTSSRIDQLSGRLAVLSRFDPAGATRPYETSGELRAEAKALREASGAAHHVLAQYADCAADLGDAILAIAAANHDDTWSVKNVAESGETVFELPKRITLKAEPKLTFVALADGQGGALYLAERALSAVDPEGGRSNPNSESWASFSAALEFCREHQVDLPTLAELQRVLAVPSNANVLDEVALAQPAFWCSDVGSASSLWKDAPGGGGALDGWHHVARIEAQGDDAPPRLEVRIAPDEAARPAIELKGVGIRPVLRVKPPR